MRNLKAAHLADSIKQPSLLFVVLDIAGRSVFREIDLKHRDFDFSLVESLLECQFHTVGLALDAIEKHADRRLRPSRHMPLLHRVDCSGERRRKNLVSFAARRLEPSATTKSRSTSPNSVLQILQSNLLSHHTPPVLGV